VNPQQWEEILIWSGESPSMERKTWEAILIWFGKSWQWEEILI
jgi:hypothetical protein